MKARFSMANRRGLPTGNHSQLPWPPFLKKNADLYLINMRGRRVAKELLESSVSESHPTWSPDGKSIVYTAPVGSNQTGLFMVKAEGASPKANFFANRLCQQLDTRLVARWKSNRFCNNRSPRKKIRLRVLSKRKRKNAATRRRLRSGLGSKQSAFNLQHGFRTAAARYRDRKIHDASQGCWRDFRARLDPLRQQFFAGEQSATNSAGATRR